MQLDDLLPSKPILTEGYEPSSVHAKFVTGAAGTGKTFLQKKAIEEDEHYGVLAATTGIAAINLGTTTLNSILKFFDTESLRDRFNRGSLSATLHKLGKKTKRLVIDEVSMMDALQLDYIFQAIAIVNEYQDMVDAPMGIVLTGDFAQLPPVKAMFAFEAACWEHFERNTETLTKVYRQDNLRFLDALNAARGGKGNEAVSILKEIGVRFRPQTINDFKGTTILPKNQQVDNFNFSQLLTIPGTSFSLEAKHWGDQSSEWKNIPDVLKLKESAYVMILSNDTEGGFSYANGDCGVIQQRDEDGTVWIKLARNELVVPIKPIIRYKTVSHDDGEKKGLDSSDLPHIFCEKDCGIDIPGKKHGPWGEHSFNCSRGSFNTGGIKFYPLRLAYATSVHKSQGLTLDNCQIDCRDPFFGDPGMSYVALSRCRTPEGLTIVGTAEKLVERIKVNPKVIRWI